MKFDDGVNMMLLFIIMTKEKKNITNYITITNYFQSRKWENVTLVFIIMMGSKNTTVSEGRCMTRRKRERQEKKEMEEDEEGEEEKN